jgi:HD-GYP domain-containing protein (c-di-GMP phosphodiesterase class II)
MSSSLAVPSLRHGDAGARRTKRQAVAAPAHDPPVPVRLRRYLPLAVLTTSLVIVVPALLVTVIVPRGGLPLMAVSAASAVAVSVAIASAGAALWKRQERSRDVVFADLMLWGWLRRCWTERRLSQARDLYDTARKAGPTVSIELLTGLSRLLEARDSYTHGHGQRVARHAGRIARAMRLSSVEIAKIRAAAAVHDVGKLYTPREILNNPRRLTDAEFAVIRRHSVDGATMLARVGDPDITAMVRHHHERIDGHGYPDCLVGSDIPLGARIIAVADTFDAITSSRAYRPAATQKKALDILSKEAGSQLDAVAVAAFLRRYSARRSVAWLALATAIPQRILGGLQTATLSFSANTGGVAAILPALGAAGLLSLSPPLHPGAPTHAGTSRRPAATLLEPLIPAAAPAAAALRQSSPPTASTRPALHGYRRSHGKVRTSPTTALLGNPTTGAANTLATPAKPGARESAAPVPARPPTSSSPEPPVSAPPSHGAPQLPAIPATPPVSVPSVNLPAVRLPASSTPIPGHTVPTVETPAVRAPEVNIPSLG